MEFKCLERTLKALLTFEFNARDALPSSLLLSSTTTRRTTLLRVGGTAAHAALQYCLRCDFDTDARL